MNDDIFLEAVGLSLTDLDEAHIESNVLKSIFDDHEARRQTLLDTGELIQRSLGRLERVHSTRVRVKSPVSLIRKIVRKRKENPDRHIVLANYKDEVRDLIGLRAFHLFKEDWEAVHDSLVRSWQLHPDEQEPIAYIRRGDDPALQDAFEKAGCKVVEKNAGYRSLHYILQTQPQKEVVFAEVQVRTLFEEAWGEIDHQVRYPDHQDDIILNDYLLILNRLAGGADEMASLLIRVKNALALSRDLVDEEAAKRGVAESELAKTKEEFNQLASELQLTKEQKEGFQQFFDQLPGRYRESPDEIVRVLQQEINKRAAIMASVRSLPPRPGSVSTVGVKADGKQREQTGAAGLAEMFQRRGPSRLADLASKANEDGEP